VTHLAQTLVPETFCSRTSLAGMGLLMTLGRSMMIGVAYLANRSLRDNEGHKIALSVLAGLRGVSSPVESMKL